MSPELKQEASARTGLESRMLAPFRDQAKNLRRYLGVYHGHFCTPAWPGGILRTLVQLKEENGFVVLPSLERCKSPHGSILHRSRCSGLAAMQGERIYLLEKAMSDDGYFAETVMFPAHRQQIKYLRGMGLGVASRPRLAPFSTRIIWKRISSRVTLREAVGSIGVFPENSRMVDPTIRKFLSAPQEADDNSKRYYDLF